MASAAITRPIWTKLTCTNDIRPVAISQMLSSSIPRFLVPAHFIEQLPSAKGTITPKVYNYLGHVDGVSNSQSEPSHEQEDDQDQDNQSQPTAGEISPVPAMGPGGQRAQKQQNQNDDQDRREHVNSSSFVASLLWAAGWSAEQSWVLPTWGQAALA